MLPQPFDNLRVVILSNRTKDKTALLRSRLLKSIRGLFYHLSFIFYLLLFLLLFYLLYSIYSSAFCLLLYSVLCLLLSVICCLLSDACLLTDTAAPWFYNSLSWTARCPYEVIQFRLCAGERDRIHRHRVPRSINRIRAPAVKIYGVITAIRLIRYESVKPIFVRCHAHRWATSLAQVYPYSFQSMVK